VKDAEDAAKSGIVIHTIGIGSTEGVPVPVVTNGHRDYLKDQDGNTVVTRLDEDILKKIALSTGGNYVRASNSNIGLDEIYAQIKRMKKQELESTMYTEYNDQFQIFAAIALFLLVVDFIIMDRRNRRLANIRLFKFKV
jgi:Ca-activated chloride channel homolog